MRICQDCQADISRRPHRRNIVRCGRCARRYHNQHRTRQRPRQVVARETYEPADSPEMYPPGLASLAQTVRGVQPPAPSAHVRDATTAYTINQYEGQEVAPGGYYWLTPDRSGPPLLIRRRCHDCGRDDRLVRGKWAPAFVEPGPPGDETGTGRYHRRREVIVLLCRRCYKVREQDFS